MATLWKILSMFFHYIADGKSYHVYNARGKHVAKYCTRKFDCPADVLKYYNDNRPTWSDHGEDAYLL